MIRILLVYFTKTKYPVFVCMTNDISFIPYKLWIFDSLNQRLDFSTLKTISSSSSSRLKIILQHHDFRKGNNILHKHPSFKKKLSSEVTKFTDNFNELMDKLVTFDGNFISFQLVLFDRKQIKHVVYSNFVVFSVQGCIDWEFILKVLWFGVLRVELENVNTVALNI